MRASEVTEVLGRLVEARLPAFVWGPPGIGKSSIVRQIAEDRGLEFLDLRLSLLDPTDLKGIPFFDPESRQGVWAPPSFLPKEGESRGILFLDEINSAPPAVQASAYQLVLDRRVGEYVLPEGWSIVAAGNRESDRGVVYRMPPPLANRFVHLEMEVSLEDWKAWAYRTGVAAELIAFLGFEPPMLFAFDPGSVEKAFPTPRSWSYVDRMLAAGLEGERLLEAISGAVGREAAVKFVSFLQVRERLPDPGAILRGERPEVEEDPRLLAILVGGLVERLRASADADALDRVLRFSMDLPGEFAVMLVKELQLAGIRVEESGAWSEWVKRYAYLLE
jgi:hypothetical protein